MIRLSDIHSVTDFQRNPKGLLGKIRASKNPAVLTVNGKAEFVVQDAASYQDLLDRVQHAEDIEAIRNGLEQSLNGQVQLATEFFDEFRKSNGL